MMGGRNICSNVAFYFFGPPPSAGTFVPISRFSMRYPQNLTGRSPSGLALATRLEPRICRQPRPCLQRQTS
jgi:hypothetical protein